MNYAYDGLPRSGAGDLFELDFSPPRVFAGTTTARVLSEDLNEKNLDERKPVNPNRPDLRVFYYPNGAPRKEFRFVRANQENVDYNADGKFEDGVATIIRPNEYLVTTRTLTDSNDWQQVELRFLDDVDSLNGLVEVELETGKPTPQDFEDGVKNTSLADLASVLTTSPLPEGPSVTVKARNLGPNAATGVSTHVTASGGTFGPLPPGCVLTEPSIATCTYNVEFEVLENTSTSAVTLPIVPVAGVPVVTVTATTVFGGEFTYNDPNHSNDTATVSFLAGPVSAYVTGDVTVGGSGSKVTGKVVGGGAVKVSGAGHQLTGGVVYGTTLTVTGAGNVINPVGQKGSTNLGSIVDLVSWRPGGLNAIAREGRPISTCRKTASARAILEVGPRH